MGTIGEACSPCSVWLCCLNDGSHTGHSRRLKEAEEGHLDVRGVMDARQELHGKERVASQLKEIVVDADLFQA